MGLKNPKVPQTEVSVLRAIPEKKYLGVEDGSDVFFYGWLVRKVFKLYGSFVSDQI